MPRLGTLARHLQTHSIVFTASMTTYTAVSPLDHKFKPGRKLGSSKEALLRGCPISTATKSEICPGPIKKFRLPRVRLESYQQPRDTGHRTAQLPLYHLRHAGQY